MKRTEILKKLKEAGFSFTEGSRHTKIMDRDGNYVSAVGRHAEIEKWVVIQIERQTGVKLR